MHRACIGRCDYMDEAIKTNQWWYKLGRKLCRQCCKSFKAFRFVCPCCGARLSITTRDTYKRVERFKYRLSSNNNHELEKRI